MKNLLLYINKNHKLLLFVLLLALPYISFAQEIGKDEAAQQAWAFMSRSHSKAIHRSQSIADLELAYTAVVDGKDCFYVFNFGDGFVIASGDERTSSPILGYSEKGHFDYDKAGESLRYVLNKMAYNINTLQRKVSSNRTNDDKYGNAVTPLLGETAWGQGWPYNNMCPMINGQHAQTGCVATALAQVMYYHKWPLQGKGSYSYTSYTNNLSISADFSQSSYQWDKMLPMYDSNSSKESCDAVALLMRDCGVSLNMDYDLGGSGAGTDYLPPALVNYFDYDPSVCLIEKDYCSFDDYESFVLNELKASRPVILGGANTTGEGSAHEFVCDGFDTDGYYHLNFGWNGHNNAYFLLSATGYDIYPSCIIGIQKNKGGEAALYGGCNVDFKYVKDNQIECALRQFTYDKNAPIEIAIAAENQATKEVSYVITVSKDDNFLAGYMAMGMSFNADLADGNYILYPVFRFSGKETWQKYMFKERCQQYVDLSVTNGVKTYANNHIDNSLDEGVVEIDHIYYRFDDTNNTASVVPRSMELKNSYSGNVKIPSSVSYGNKDYTVTSIGKSAFGHCSELGSVYIPATVERIEYAAFSISSADLVIESGSKLNYIGGWGLNGCSTTKLELPEGFEELGMCALQSCGMSYLSIPSTLSRYGGDSFNASCEKLHTLKVGFATPNSLFESELRKSNVIPQSIRLLVPSGSADTYKAHEYWGQMQIEEYISNTSTATIVKQNDGSVAIVSDSQAEGSYTIPETINDGISVCQVSSIGADAFKNCVNMTDVSIPSSVTSIGSNAFAGCSNLTSISIYASTPPTLGSEEVNSVSRRTPSKESAETVFFGVSLDDCILYVPKGCIDAYRAANGWGQFTNIVEINNQGIQLPSAENNSGNNRVYNINGVHYKHGAPLPYGVYIINGKKKVVK